MHSLTVSGLSVSSMRSFWAWTVSRATSAVTDLVQHALGLVEAARSVELTQGWTHVPQSSATSTPRPLVISSSFLGMSLRRQQAP